MNVFDPTLPFDDSDVDPQDLPRYEVQVSGDGHTVWVNGHDGMCWARFSKRFGIDVHRQSAMETTGTECLYCTHEPAGLAEWERFRAEVLKHHHAVVPFDTLTFS